MQPGSQPCGAQAVAKGPGQMLSTVTLVAAAARQLQDHYGAQVAPALEGAPAADAAAEAAAGLTAALQHLQQESLDCLSTSINAFFIQVLSWHHHGAGTATTALLADPARRKAVILALACSAMER